MKNCILLLLLAVFGYSHAHAQSYQGYRTGNYTGVNGVFFNPASVVDSRYSWDLNLGGLSFLAGTNKASLSVKDVTSGFNADSLLNQFTTPGPTNGIIYTDVHGPSLMLNLGKKTAIAFTTRGVAMVNITNLDGALINQIVSDGGNSISYPYSVTMAGVSGITAHAYTEYGFTLGKVLLSKPHAALKAAVTAKYLSGAGNLYLRLSDFKGTLNNDVAQGRSYLTNTTGSVDLGFGGIRFSDFKLQDVLKSSSTGWGADVGLVYEWRNNTSLSRRDLNKYKLRLGVALQDFGKISYERDPARSAAYGVNITGTQRFYTDELEDAPVDSFKTILDRYPQYFTKGSGASGSYKAALPTSVSIDADYHLMKGFYINVGAQIPLTSNSGNAWDTYKLFSATVTPRFEGRGLGLFLPLSYHEVTGLTAGAGLRLGPLFIGSGSILNAINGKTKQADFYFGLHLGRLFHNKGNKDRDD